MRDTETGPHTRAYGCQVGENHLSVDWVITDEWTKRVALCVALSLGKQPWGAEEEALARLGPLAPLKGKETYSVPPPPSISFFSF